MDDLIVQFGDTHYGNSLYKQMVQLYNKLIVLQVPTKHHELKQQWWWALVEHLEECRQFLVQYIPIPTDIKATHAWIALYRAAIRQNIVYQVEQEHEHESYKHKQ